MRRTPTLPARRLSQNSLAPTPNGEMTPMPVMTTRLFMVNGLLFDVARRQPSMGNRRRTTDISQSDCGAQPVRLEQLGKLFGEHEVVFGELQPGHVLIDLAEH